MRKFARMLLPVLALTMVFPFGSCGGKDDLPPEAEGKTVVKVAFYAAGFGTRWMEDAKERYEALHPDVYLKLEGDPYIEDTVKQRLDTNKAELADDLCVFGGTYYRYMIRNNQLTELSSFYDELVEGDDTVNDLVNQQLKDYFTVNGEIYAIPWQDNAMSIVKDIMLGNVKLNELGRHEEALGRNAIFGGFQGQRMWTDYKPNGDYTEAILNSTFDWNGKKQPLILATESDNCNGLTMLFENLLTGRASIFADVRTYWSKEAVERVTGWTAEGRAADGFIHLLNSGAAALDGTGASKDEKGNSIMKEWWKVTEKDIGEMLEATRFSPANRGYFRGGGFSSTYSTKGEMPVTLARVNMVDGIGYTMQIAEGWTVDLPEQVDKILLNRTDPTWPSTWFVPRLNTTNAFSSVYNVMSNWGANHGAFCYGHIGAELITLASMYRIPVSLHNIEEQDIYRPHAWSAFGTKDLESADYRACAHYGELYK